MEDFTNSTVIEMAESLAWHRDRLKTEPHGYSIEARKHDEDGNVIPAQAHDALYWGVYADFHYQGSYHLGDYRTQAEAAKALGELLNLKTHTTLSDIASITFFTACDNCGSSDVPEDEYLCRKCKPPRKSA